MLARKYAQRIEQLEAKILASSESYSAVFGIVEAGGELLRSVKKVDGEWREVSSEAEIYTAEKLERVLQSKKRFVVVIGGRGSIKSIGVHDILLSRVRDNGEKWMCMREYQRSIADSVHSLLSDEIDRLSMSGFRVQEQTIFSDSGGEIRFNGLRRNPEGIKSAHGFNGFCVEEAATLSAKSIRALTPTARNKAKFGTPAQILAREKTETKNELSNVQMFFIANPGSATDPFSERFINPYLDEVNRNGFYEDDLHLVVMINWRDNPWFGLSGLEKERQHDLANVSPALYEHTWEGAFLDEVENSIITQEWFNACVDAHVKLGFKARGAVIVSLDPSDEGKDPKGLTVRQGSVILECLQNSEGDAFSCIKWAADICRKYNADHFIWDCDGMGATLRNEVAQQLAGLKIQVHQYRGSAGVANPKAMYAFDNKGLPMRNTCANEDVFKNRRSQRTWGIRDRIYYTWRAVMCGEYSDPDKLISFSSSIKDMGVLRSEACKIPLKAGVPTGVIQVMSKAEMRKAPLCIKSPNMFDSVVMSDDIPSVISVQPAASAPRPIKRFSM